ncbi:hypothetical protein X801_02551 [Opisthorchis viverrini]|uniref:non-specific serine/threonine protein kinase n=1 Tax=Opisthorchis viverrini TaxID=6198 RepID=A0A1S8X4I2_OPIVI|nr:hypothetical protein X801_02551 [Opisthorchis viverrini]
MAELFFRDIMRFCRFKHAYVPRISEAFVSINATTRAVYFSVIRPYIDAPSLTSYLEKYFMNKCIERRIIFRTFGCLLDFLIRLKSSGFQHMYYLGNFILYSLVLRNLHPNNIFINESEAYTTDCWSINLENYIRGTDFFQLEFDHLYDPSLVARVPVECPPEPEFRRRKPRFTEWCAPEVDNFQYNDRSDLWSLACMMQIMLNVKDLTADDMNWALQTLKSNPKSFFPLNNQSTDDEVKFVKILNSMLEPDPEKRMSLEQLVQDPFVEAILEQADPESLARANRCIVRMADRLLPAEDGERAVRDYLIRNWRHENCVEGAVIWFAEHCCHSNAGLPPHLSGVLFNVLDLHKANAKLVHNTLIVLNHCVYLRYTVIELPSPSTESRTAENDQNEAKEFKYSLENEDFVIILNAMKQHPQDQVIQEAALKLLDSLLGASHSNVDVEVVRNYLATRQHVFDHLIKIGLITYLLELLQSHMYELARLGAEYLWKYCFYAPIARMVGESKALITVLYLMRNYPEDIKLFTGGPLLILALSSCVTVLKFFCRNSSEEAASYVRRRADSATGSGPIQQLPRYNLEYMSWPECKHFALHFVGIDGETEYQTDGCGLLHALYRTYHDSTAIIEGLMRVINAVMQYEDLLGNKNTHSLKSILRTIASTPDEHPLLLIIEKLRNLSDFLSHKDLEYSGITTVLGFSHENNASSSDVIGLYKYEFHRNLPDIERRISMPFASDDIVVVRMNGKKSIKSMLKEISTRFREHKVVGSLVTQWYLKPANSLQLVSLIHSNASDLKKEIKLYSVQLVTSRETPVESLSGSKGKEHKNILKGFLKAEVVFKCRI